MKTYQDISVGRSRTKTPNIVPHPHGIPDGEPLLVHDIEDKYGGGLVVVRGVDAVVKAYDAGQADFDSNVVVGFTDNDGNQRQPTPDEVLQIVRDQAEIDTLVPIASEPEVRVFPMTWRQADEWIVGGVERSKLPPEAKLMQTLHAFNTAGYLNPANQHETLTRVAAKFGWSMDQMTKALRAYSRVYPIQQSDPPSKDFKVLPLKQESTGWRYSDNLTTPNDLAMARAIERVDAARRDDLWKTSPALAALSEGALPTDLPPGTHTFEADEIKRRIDLLNAERSGLSETAVKLSGFLDDVLDKNSGQPDMENMRRMVDDGSLAKSVLEAYRAGTFQMVTEDGRVVDATEITEIELDCPDGPLSGTDQITVRAKMRDGAEVTALEPRRVPFALSIPHFSCGYPGCGLRLNRYFDESKRHLGLGAYTWVHGRAVETLNLPPHKEQPVPDAFQAARLICDFCSTLDPEWSLGCNDYESFLNRANSRAVVHSSDRRWACCQRCKDLLDAGRMDEVTENALASILAERDKLNVPDVVAVMRAELEEMHQGFLANRTFDDRLFADGAPL